MGKSYRFHSLLQQYALGEESDERPPVSMMCTPGARISFSKVIERPGFRNIEIENTFENSMAG